MNYICKFNIQLHLLQCTSHQLIPLDGSSVVMGYPTITTINSPYKLLGNTVCV